MLGEHRPDLAAELHPNDEGPTPWDSPTLLPTRDGIEDTARLLLPPQPRPQRWQPFTLSPLGTPVQPRAHGSTTLRITSVHHGLSDWLGGLEAEDFGSIRLGRVDPVDLRVLTILKDAEQDPWAGASSWQDLVARWTTPRRVSSLVRLDFLTPTTFRKASGHRRWNVVFPTPEEVLGSLAEKWEAFAPLRLRFASNVDLEGAVMASRYQLESCYLTDGGFPAKGFHGRCEYRTAKDADDVTTRVVHVLIDFAFYAGIGSMTTMGMGQVWPSHLADPTLRPYRTRRRTESTASMPTDSS